MEATRTVMIRKFTGANDAFATVAPAHARPGECGPNASHVAIDSVPSSVSDKEVAELVRHTVDMTGFADVPARHRFGFGEIGKGRIVRS